jgi:hypothetical protein
MLAACLSQAAGCAPCTSASAGRAGVSVCTLLAAPQAWPQSSRPRTISQLLAVCSVQHYYCAAEAAEARCSSSSSSSRSSSRVQAVGCSSSSRLHCAAAVGSGSRVTCADSLQEAQGSALSPAKVPFHDHVTSTMLWMHLMAALRPELSRQAAAGVFEALGRGIPLQRMPNSIKRDCQC